MNSRHRKTLEAVFAIPTKSNIAWTEIEALLISIGCKVVEGSESRVRFNHTLGIFIAHRPHPQKEIKQYSVKLVREFLVLVGIEP